MRQTLLFFFALKLASAAFGSEGFAYARYVPERKDDIALENDKIALRIYGPALQGSAERSGIDCWLKRVDYPIVDKWYRESKMGKSYHKDHGEGYDPYHVGASLGCGGLALWHGGKMHVANVYENYRIKENWPKRAVVEVEYAWEGLPFQAREYRSIIIEPGSQLFKVESRITIDNRPAIVDVAIGVSTHEGRALAYADRQNRWVAAWESYGDSGLGTGVVLTRPLAATPITIRGNLKDQSHIILRVSTDSNGEIEYHAGFAWSKAGEITRSTAWQNYLDNHR